MPYSYSSSNNSGGDSAADVVKHIFMLLMLLGVVAVCIWLGVELKRLTDRVKKSQEVDKASAAAISEMSAYLLNNQSKVSTIQKERAKDATNINGVNSGIQNLNSLLVDMTQRQAAMYDLVSRTPYCVVPKNAAPVTPTEPTTVATPATPVATTGTATTGTTGTTVLKV